MTKREAVCSSYGFGRPLAGGRQFVSWIHDRDIEHAIELLIQRDDMKGVSALAERWYLQLDDRTRQLVQPAVARAQRIFLFGCPECCDNLRMNDRNVLGWSIAMLLVATPSALAQNRSVPWFERSAFLHFAASAELATNGYALGAAFSDDKRVRLASGAALALTAGFAKELYDLSANGDFSWRDIAWDVIGTATGLLISWLVDRFLFGPRHGSVADSLGFSVARPLAIAF